MLVKRRIRGRFASVVETPHGEGGLRVGKLLYVVNPPQVTSAVYRGTLVNLEPVNNKTPCWREIETPSEEGGVGYGKDADRHDNAPQKGRRIVSRISEVVKQSGGLTPRKLYEVAGVKKTPKKK